MTTTAGENGAPAGTEGAPAPTGDQQTNTNAQQGGVPNPAPPANQAAQETPEQVIARLQGDVERLSREKDSVRIAKEGELKREAQRKQLLSMAEATGVKIDDPTKETVESLYEKMTGKVLSGDQQTEAQVAELNQAKIDLAIYKIAGKADVRVDPDKLANRVSFVKAVAGLDPSADTFEASLKAAIEAEAKNDPSIKVSGGTSTSGADQYGGAGGGQITKEAFSKMSVSERTTLFKADPVQYERLANS